MKTANDITIDYTNTLAPAIGETDGITEEELSDVLTRGAKAVKDLADKRASGEIGFYDLPSADTKQIIKFASTVREKVDNLIVLGIGGSALGTNAIQSALNPSFYNQLPKRKRNGYPKLYVADNIDPDWFEEILSITDPSKSIFNVISKSGTTAETMSQFMIVFDRLKKALKGKWKKKIVITTDEAKGVLREIVDEHKLTSFSVPDNVGGRFSIFTPVGLVPLACVGIDIDSLLAGAAQMAKRCEETDPVKNPAVIFSALHYIADVKKGKKMTVMIPYSTKLYSTADWFRQLWAESLGKKVDTEGKTVNTGQTPIKALGVTDQHSQVQLYVEGPNDKMTVFIEVEKFDKEVEIPAVFEEKAPLAYLTGKTLNRLIKTEMEGTEYALTQHNRPNMTIRMPELNANTLGQLMFLLEASTAISGGLYGIDPFDQPGVEFGKQYTYAMMGRPGFEEMKKDIETKAGTINRKSI